MGFRKEQIPPEGPRKNTPYWNIIDDKQAKLLIISKIPEILLKRTMPFSLMSQINEDTIIMKLPITQKITDIMVFPE